MFDLLSSVFAGPLLSVYEYVDHLEFTWEDIEALAPRILRWAELAKKWGEVFYRVAQYINRCLIFQ